jgi:hypothetical protein
MILPNIAFDALLFGLILIAAAVDSAFPITHGAASLFIIGGATYWAAQEISEWVLRRIGWTQEPLATATALCAGGFLYFLLRNQSDLSLLALSIGLMMGALMVAISIIAAIGTAVREGQPSAFSGWVFTTLLSGCLGVTGGVLAIVLGADVTSSLSLKVAAILVALVLWKLREKLSPPDANPHFTTQTAKAVSPANAGINPQRIALFPQRGTLLDRLVPLLVLGAIFSFAAKELIPVPVPTSPITAEPVTTSDQ